MRERVYLQPCCFILGIVFFVVVVVVVFVFMLLCVVLCCVGLFRLAVAAVVVGFFRFLSLFTLCLLPDENYAMHALA